jgi:hypothetical protein
MSDKESKVKKPKYPETVLGTHCMGENWTVCCPNKHLQFDRYQPTKDVIQIKYNGGVYRVFVCTKKCVKDITSMAKDNPEHFKSVFIKSVKPNGDLVLKHRDTGVVAQIAKKVDTYDKNEKSSSGGGYSSKRLKKTKKRRGGNIRKITKMLMTHRKRTHKRGCGHTMKHRRL